MTGAAFLLYELHLDMHVAYLEDLRVKATAVDQPADLCKCWLGVAFGQQHLESYECTVHTVGFQVGRDVQKFQCPLHGSKDDAIWGSVPCITIK